MAGPQLCLSGFSRPATPRTSFCASPRLTIQAAFNHMARTLPPQGCVIFHDHREGISADIYPHCGPEDALNDFAPEPSHYAFRLYPAHQTAVITRIHSAAARRGLGTAMMASQYDFMREAGVRYLSVVTHDKAAGFYQKLGFAAVDHLPEKPDFDGQLYTLMRLDLHDAAQKNNFEAALARVKPLVP